MEEPLTKLELGIGRLGLYRDIAYRCIMDDYERSLIWRLLLFDGEGWSLKSLAERIRTPRATVRRKVRLLEKRGFVEWRGGGLYLTQWGRSYLMSIFRNGVRIAKGEQIGWPDDIIEVARRIGYCADDADSIHFPNSKNLVIK